MSDGGSCVSARRSVRARVIQTRAAQIVVMAGIIAARGGAIAGRVAGATTAISKRTRAKVTVDAAVITTAAPAASLG